MEQNLKIIIPCFNCPEWIGKCLKSLEDQTFNNYNVIIIDDASTNEKHIEIIEDYSKRNSWQLCINKTNKGALFNIIYGIDQLCTDDNDVIITLDGDDWLAANDVLDRINDAYQQNILLTYGQFSYYSEDEKLNNTIGYCEPRTFEDIYGGRLRSAGWVFSHLRTFKYLLFKNIDKFDMIDPKTNEFYRVTWDMSFMFPMIEMSNGRIQMIEQPSLYIYNAANQLNDFKLRQTEQEEAEKHIRALQPYKPLKDTKYFITMLNIGENGRLGNQIFQYVILRHIANVKNMRLVIPKKRSNNPCHNFKLDSLFDLDLEFCDDVTTGINTNIEFNNFLTINDPTFHFTDVMPKITGQEHINLNGYYQSAKYFNDDVVKSLKFVPDVKNEAEIFINKLRQNYDCIVSLHIRRGDNVPKQRGKVIGGGEIGDTTPHKVFTKEYIVNCIEYFENKCKETSNNILFLVFSDNNMEINWCKQNIFNDLSYNISYSIGHDDVVDLAIMSMCDHNVISPSSFSWWAAYLNKNSEKIVIVPDPWFNPEHDHLKNSIVDDLLPENWLRFEI
jgi:glycosyltransferase involved in cell wall biosynthesis